MNRPTACMVYITCWQRRTSRPCSSSWPSCSTCCSRASSLFCFSNSARRSFTFSSSFMRDSASVLAASNSAECWSMVRASSWAYLPCTLTRHGKLHPQPHSHSHTHTHTHTATHTHTYTHTKAEQPRYLHEKAIGVDTEDERATANRRRGYRCSTGVATRYARAPASTRGRHTLDHRA